MPITKRPCSNYPFRKDGAGIDLRPGRMEGIITHLKADDQQTFICHKTLNKSRMTCAGAVGVMSKVVDPANLNWKTTMFDNGDWVEWESSSSGVTKAKCGRIEAVIPAKGYPTAEQRKEADASGIPRTHVSYLVRVPGKTMKSKGKLYWPRVAALRHKSPQN